MAPSCIESNHLSTRVDASISPAGSDDCLDPSGYRLNGRLQSPLNRALTLGLSLKAVEVSSVILDRRPISPYTTSARCSALAFRFVRSGT